MQVGDTDLEGGVLPGAHAQPLDLGLAAGVHLLDPGRVDPAVRDELLQRQPTDLAADRVEAAEQHRLGGVVDDQVDPGDLLEGPDVAALPADDPALHVVAGQRDRGDHRLGGLLRGDPLDHRAEDPPGPDLGLVLGGALDVAGQDRGGPLGVGLDGLDQLDARVLRGETGEPLEHPTPLVLDVEQLGAALLEGGLHLDELLGALLEVALLEVEALLALGEPVLAALDVVALVLQVLVQVVLAPRHALAVDEHHHDGGDGERHDDPEDQQLDDSQIRHVRLHLRRAYDGSPTRTTPPGVPRWAGGRSSSQQVSCAVPARGPGLSCAVQVPVARISRVSLLRLGRSPKPVKKVRFAA